MNNYLEKLYEILKNGHSRGVVINPFFTNIDDDQLVRIYNRAINDGFAQVPAITHGYSSELILQLTDEGKQYPTYKDYCDRYKRSEMSISNSIFGNNNSSNNVGQDFKNVPLPNSETTDVKNNKHEVKMSTAQFIVWLLTFFGTGIGIGFAICNAMKP